MKKWIETKFALVIFIAVIVLGAQAHSIQHITLEDGQIAESPDAENGETSPPKRCRPVVHTRYPPNMPGHCENIAGDEHFVRIRYDINEFGETENIHVLDYSNICLVDASKRAVSRWLYNCDGANRKDVETEITFSRD